MAHLLTHGIDAFFRERSSARRRVAWALITVSGLSLVVMASFGRRLVETPARYLEQFGYAGPDVPHEFINMQRNRSEQSGLSSFASVSASRGKGPKPHPATTNPNAPPLTIRLPGDDSSDQDLVVKARMLSLNAPVISSHELVVDRFVQPEYPPEHLSNDVEGVVEILALIDTAGTVHQVQVFGGTPDSLFMASATKALFENRYRPYRVADRAREVWIPYRFRFSIHRMEQ